jgi:hypothetical protein
MNLIVVIKQGFDYRDLFNDLNIKIIKEIEVNRFLIYLPLPDGMGSSPIEDLNEAEEVFQLFWDDGTICCPRG